MFFSSLILAIAVVAADEPKKSSDAAQEALQALHREEAGRWTMYLDAAHKLKAAFREKPIYVWTNPTRSQGQHGSVFVWTHEGRPVAIGSTFSHPESQKRMLCHEFHSLATGDLFPARSGSEANWTPKAPIDFQKLPGAPAPKALPARRLLQMKEFARWFTAHSIDYQKERWELRLLPNPLHRYEKPSGEASDGALFAFVTSAGTDPEVILAFEVRGEGDKAAWYYRGIRFSDSNLYVQLKDKEVWSSVRDDKHTLHSNPDHTYCLIRDRYLEELPELAQ